LGSRRYDDFDSKTGTAYEGNTTPWSWITPKKLQEKLHQVASDILLLKNRRSGVKKVIWFGTEPLPTKGPAVLPQLKMKFVSGRLGNSLTGDSTHEFQPPSLHT
jgi:hypothetical protein